MVLGVKEVDGKHTGCNLAAYFLEILQSYGVEEKLFCVTADNASNNSTLAKELDSKLQNFLAKQNMLGCVGHVVNLAAKAGLKTLEIDAAEGCSSNKVGSLNGSKINWITNKITQL